MDKTTPFKASIWVEDIVVVSLKLISEKGGSASIDDIYNKINSFMNLDDMELNAAGKSSVRLTIQRAAKERMGLIQSEKRGSYSLTEKGVEYLVKKTIMYQFITD